MKRLIFIILFLDIGFLTNAVAQTSVSRDTSCDFLKNLKFKNGVDTIVTKATYGELLKSADYPILKELDKEKKLHYDEFGVDTNEEDASTAMLFTPVNCSKSYNITISRKIFDSTLNKNITTDINTLKHGEIIYLTCVVFEGNIYVYNQLYADYKHPYFVIIDIALKKPN